MGQDLAVESVSSDSWPWSIVIKSIFFDLNVISELLRMTACVYSRWDSVIITRRHTCLTVESRLSTAWTNRALVVFKEKSLSNPVHAIALRLSLRNLCYQRMRRRYQCDSGECHRHWVRSEATGGGRENVKEREDGLSGFELNKYTLLHTHTRLWFVSYDLFEN